MSLLNKQHLMMGTIEELVGIPPNCRDLRSGDWDPNLATLPIPIQKKMAE